MWCAFAFGMLHAAFSVYWAVGGRWLLPTVGQWAVRAAAQNPGQTGLVLGGVALAKAVGATVPVLVAYNRLPWRRTWRGLSWLGGTVLILYGAINVTVSGAVLLGFTRPADGYDRNAMIGHALLWDPLFAVWGAALITHLWSSRNQRPRSLLPRW